MFSRNRLLICILLLAAVLRLVALGKVPAGFTADEASQGYAAYSLLQTGKDEWGLSWPIASFRAFGDFRAPLQTYLIIPSVALFGLDEFAVRLPSAIFGVLAVLAVYLLSHEMFGKKNTALLAALFMAISPWAIQFSRTALEANFGSFLFPLGLFLFLKGVKGDRRLLSFSAFVLSVDLYSYLAAKLFIPLFLIAVFIYFRREVFKRGLSFFAPFIIIFSLLAAPIYFDTFFGPGNTRGQDLIITNFSEGDIASIGTEQYFSPLNRVVVSLPRIFSNKAIFVLHQFVGNYISYLSPSFWFSEGGREITYSVFPGHGLLPLWFLPFVLFAFYRLVFTKDKTLPILLIWLFLAIIPAAITKEGYRPNRVGSLLGFFENITAYGVIEFINSRKKFRKLYTLAVTLLGAIFLLFYLNLYFFTSSVKYPSSLSYGYRQLIGKVDALSDSFNQVIFDKGDQSQTFVAFYTKTDPTVFQKHSASWWPRIEERKLLFVDMLDPYSLNQYTFKTFDRSADLVEGNLVILKGVKMNDTLKPFIIDEVLHPDQTTAFYLLKYDPKKDPSYSDSPQPVVKTCPCEI